MKRLLLGSLAAMALFVLAAPAHAMIMPHWDVTGHYVTTFQYSGAYAHDMDLVQDASGNVTGSGGYPAGGPYVYHWVITSGTVSADQIHLTMDYDLGAVGTTMHMSGTIAADGTMSGNWDDNYGGTRTGTWATTAGAANVTFEPAWGKELSAAACSGKVGSPVINVTEKVTNDVDSGAGGNNWAFDNYNRHIQVWKTKTAGTYCALATYEGTADAVEGQVGPAGGSDTIGADVSATMKGGYRATITGTLKSSPDWKTKGSVGTVNYGCTDISGTGCSPVSWVDKYFNPGSVFTYSWWGWLYDAGTHGSWLNSDSGNWGNIL